MHGAGFAYVESRRPRCCCSLTSPTRFERESDESLLGTLCACSLQAAPKVLAPLDLSLCAPQTDAHFPIVLSNHRTRRGPLCVLSGIHRSIPVRRRLVRVLLSLSVSLSCHSFVVVSAGEGRQLILLLPLCPGGGRRRGCSLQRPPHRKGAAGGRGPDGQATIGTAPDQNSFGRLGPRLCMPSASWGMPKGRPLVGRLFLIASPPGHHPAASPLYLLIYWTGGFVGRMRQYGMARSSWAAQ